MPSLQVLIDQKAALEDEVAKTLKAAQEKKRALEIQIQKERAEEIVRGRAEIERLMQKYSLSVADVFGSGTLLKSAQAKDKPGYLSEIREYYNGRFL